MGAVEIRQVEYFVAVAEELSFTRAAQRLSMTQPALSRAIRALEKNVGAALLVRTRTASRSPTPAGPCSMKAPRSWHGWPT
ncbi:LysR family transcriptional regulator [Streptomyces sp. NPDC005263]|uniref:helix-turn-helix domain-containing protein n=1 Tax=Streptomyces sp. NPDC005263 TaxID=3364711 RepID=UPI0036941C89